MAELVKESIPGALVKLKSADLHLDQETLARKLREVLPTVDEMVTSMYQKIEERGAQILSTAHQQLGAIYA